MFALITGASSGIGIKLANEAARDGYDVILVARREEKLLQLADELKERFKIATVVIDADLSKKEGVKKVLDAIVAHNYQVEMLINNAGFGLFGDFVAMDDAISRQMIGLNITALTELTHACLKGMVKRKHGYILNVASIAGFFPGPYMAVYYATKAYVLSFSEALSEEVRNCGVYVTALCPGPTATEFSSHVSSEGMGIFRGMLPSADEVAHFGYVALQHKRVVAVHGFKNRVWIQITRFLPRCLIRYIIARLHKK